MIRCEKSIDLTLLTLFLVLEAHLEFLNFAFMQIPFIDEIIACFLNKILYS